VYQFLKIAIILLVATAIVEQLFLT